MTLDRPHFLKEDEKLKVVVVAKSLDLEYWRIFESGAKKAFNLRER